MKKVIVLGCLLLSFLVWFGQNSKKHQFALCAIFQNEASFLKKWIDHHTTLGVDHFFLYNCGSTDNYQEVLKLYIDQGLVELIEWEPSEDHALKGWSQDYILEPSLWNAYKIGAYNDCISNRALQNVKWLGCINIEEYLVSSSEGEAIHNLLRRHTIYIPFFSTGSLKIFSLEDPKKFRALHRPESTAVALTNRAILREGYKRKKVSPKTIKLTTEIRSAT